MRKAPSPVIAALLSGVCCQGLGHVYAGNPRRALLWGAAPLALLPTVALVAHTRMLPWAFLVLVLGYGAAWLGAIVDAARTASRSAGPRAPFWHLLAFWAAVEVMTVGGAMAERRFVLEAFKIPSGSMFPALLIGDHIFVDKLRAAQRGDIIVFPFPEHPEQDYVKRVVGLPGDQLEIRGGHPIVNGAAIRSCRVGDFRYKARDEGATEQAGELFVEVLGDRTYLAFYDRSAAGADRGQGELLTVKPGELFVLGDNRDNAYDSRFWFAGRGGGVPVEGVHGVGFVVYLAEDMSRSGLSLDEPHLPPGAEALKREFARCLGEVRGK